MKGRAWSPGEREAALRRIAGGETRADVSRSTGIGYSTLQQWQSGRIPPPSRVKHEPQPWPLRDEVAYSYLLGVYLGDGCLRRNGGYSWALQVSLDDIYPMIVEEVGLAIQWLRDRGPSVLDHRTKRMVTVVSHWKHWPAYFPQHGPGRKHSRPIVLQPWQRETVERHPGELLRGLIHTDGWRGENRVVSKGKAYSYPRYQFSNRSDDIRQIFCDGCDLLGIAWRPWGRWHISVARRDAVARLDEYVGLKT